MWIRNNIYIGSIFFVLVACTGLKRLPPGEKLYTGAKVKLVYSGKIKHKNDIISSAKSAIRPQPNQSFLGMRPKLWLYQKADSLKKKKLKEKLKDQGEPPVLASDVKPAETAKFIDAKLFNAGIFNAITSYKIIETKRTVKILYTSHIHIPYQMNEVNYEIKNPKIDSLFQAGRKKTLLNKGDNYNLETIKKERERLDDILKNDGYFFFRPDYLLFKADTLSATKKVNLSLSLKDETLPRALQQFRISNITINPDYSLENHAQQDSLAQEPLVVDSVVFTKKETKVKPWVILQNVSFKPHDLYSRKKHNSTLNRLMTMGTYKFVRIKFTPEDSALTNTLDMRILLTPMDKRTLRSEANMVSKSNDFIGPQVNINYLNRNAFNGAELLNVNLGGSFETQIIGKYKNLYSYSINSKVEIFFPRFVVPIPLNHPNNFYVPKTKMSVGYNYLKRIAYFDLRSLQFIYGFKWKESACKDHELNPININLVSIVNRTPAFNDLLAANPFIQKSYSEQFIAGAWYSFLYSEQILPNKKNQLYFNVVAETSGNTFSLFNQLRGNPPNDERPNKIAGIVYSQFGKLSTDLRNYLNFKHSKIATRLFAGAGKAYGNSSTLPYIKQFFSGGANSVRAFPINSLGPGTHSTEIRGASLFLQQGGDIKLEGNLEYRFDIFKSLKGAIFTDAGNVWLFKSNPAVTGDPFSVDKFYKEIAVGAGIGLRIDITFFVLRFDVAAPLRKPWLPENERWVINKLAFGNPAWRGDNLILNVAIGYPF
ncbi:MAG: BamA/TamA family outer membrane protein [Bacteroidetes bacterium]|nr:BamA/TamA family outer membrane protein [Bacteroidota bacterium]